MAVLKIWNIKTSVKDYENTIWKGHGLGVEKKIGEIKNELKAACESELPVFVKMYEGDGRSGVQQLVAKARKSIDAYEKEKQRTECMKKYEKEYASYGSICGIDEAGRGPLAGPVVAGAVIFQRFQTAEREKAGRTVRCDHERSSGGGNRVCVA